MLARILIFAHVGPNVVLCQDSTRLVVPSYIGVCEGTAMHCQVV